MNHLIPDCLKGTSYYDEEGNRRTPEEQKRYIEEEARKRIEGKRKMIMMKPPAE